MELFSFPDGRVATPAERAELVAQPFDLVLVFNDFRAALHAHLLARPAIAALFGAGIYPLIVPQGVSLPAITYQVITDITGKNLAGADGTSTARVQIRVQSADITDCVAGSEALRNAFDGSPVFLGALLEVISVFQVDTMDGYDEPDNATDTGTFFLLSDYRFKYRITKPTLQ